MVRQQVKVCRLHVTDTSGDLAVLERQLLEVRDGPRQLRRAALHCYVAVSIGELGHVGKEHFALVAIVEPHNDFRIFCSCT